MSENETLLNKIKSVKDEKGLTLKRLSEKSGISLGTINKLFSGASKGIKADQLIKLARALDVSLESITEKPLPLKDKPKFYGFVKTAALSADVKVADCLYNSASVVEAAKRAAKDGVKIAVFPELCITGYTCGDLFFQESLINSAAQCLLNMARELKDTEIFVTVGLPVAFGGNLYNAAAALFKGEILGIVPKSYLPGYDEFYEKRHFSPALETNSTLLLDGKEIPFGTKLLFVDSLYRELCIAVEICEDLWVASSPSSSHALAGATVICNLSASNETVGKADFRRQLISVQSAKTVSTYIYANPCPNESTTDTVYSAHNIIAENGKLIAESRPFGDGAAFAETDISYTAFQRRKNFGAVNQLGYEKIYFECELADCPPSRKYPKNLFLPEDAEQRKRYLENILEIQSYALLKRITHINCKKLIIGVSGGTDSTLALIVAAKTLKKARRPSCDIIAVTMPCFGTTKRTLNNSTALAEAYGATVRQIDVTESVRKHFKDIGHDENVRDAVYENSQARERTQVLMDIANAEDGIVIGTGDLSELALGWCTYNGDHMSMYGINSSVAKTVVYELIRFEAQHAGAAVGNILCDILDTPVSPELLPHDNGAITQITENSIGPYELNDYFLYMTIKNGFMPSKIFLLAKISFAEKYLESVIYLWLEKFIKRFFSQQYKRSCMPDGVKTGVLSLSPRGDWRMPSDASARVWLDDLATVKPENLQTVNL